MKKGAWKIFEFEEFDCLCEATANEDGEYQIRFAISISPGNIADAKIGGYLTIEELKEKFDSVTKENATPLIQNIVGMIKDAGFWDIEEAKANQQ